MLHAIVFSLALQSDIQTKPLYPHLAAEILARTKADQEGRKRFIDANTKKAANLKRIVAELRQIDHENTERMKWIIQKFGWPTAPMVGDEAENDAWLLVQHADQDHPFQKKCLMILEPLAKEGKIPGRQYAYLYDRVQTGEKKLQRYGTQGGSIKDGFVSIQPCEDPDHLDARRKALDLEPEETYLKEIADMYHVKVAPNWRELIRPKVAK